MKIAFRADASPSIGTGHVMRCLALAQELQSRQARIEFVSSDLPGHLASLISQSGFTLSDEVPGCDWLVVDHYGLDVAWERRARARAAKIMAIDDQARRAHDCDLLLDQNVLSGGNAYESLVPEASRLCFGPRYALLRRAFADERARAPARSGEIRRVLVCFGGTDPHNHTAAALEALRREAQRLDVVDVVIGPASRFADEIAKACRLLSGAKLHRGSDDLPALLARADLAIGAGGTMVWERACMGAPTLAFGIAANQVPVLEALFKAGLAAGEASMPQPQTEGIAKWVRVALQDAQGMRAMAARAAELVDGQGARRVADAMLTQPIHFRRATMDDAVNILRWRNHPRVRGASHDDAEIDAASHAAWMQRVLADPARVLLIAECGGQPVGVVRFDLRGRAALISVYRTPETMAGSRGLIRAATAWLGTQHPEVAEVSAEILADNAGSLAAFRKAGYEDGKGVLRYDMTKKR